MSDTTPGPDRPSRLILIVEDMALIAFDLAATLEDGGYRVLGPAPTIDTALTLLSRTRPDAAVLDMNLQGESVTPLARLLRQMGVPFILSTAYGRAEMRNDAALTGAPYLPKPVARGALISALRSLLDGAG